jgi:chaperonin cofactor prefoldin
LVQKTKIEFELKETLNKAKNDIDTATDNAKIYQEVIQERRRFIMSSYVMKEQEDLEMILETLHDHFKLIKLTSFEELARNNSMNMSAK